MIGLLSKVIIIDNSGGLIGRCIKVLKAKQGFVVGNIGDIIIISQYSILINFRVKVDPKFQL